MPVPGAKSMEAQSGPSSAESAERWMGRAASKGAPGFRTGAGRPMPCCGAARAGPETSWAYAQDPRRRRGLGHPCGIGSEPARTAWNGPPWHLAPSASSRILCNLCVNISLVAIADAFPPWTMRHEPIPFTGRHEPSPVSGRTGQRHKVRNMAVSSVSARTAGFRPNRLKHPAISHVRQRATEWFTRDNGCSGAGRSRYWRPPHAWMIWTLPMARNQHCARFPPAPEHSS